MVVGMYFFFFRAKMGMVRKCLVHGGSEYF